MTRFVENIQDARQVGVILDLHDTANRLGEKWKLAYAATDAAVLRLLPLLHPHDADILNTQQREHLRRRLFRPGYIFLVGDWANPVDSLAVLSALEHIGDKRDLPDLERLLRDQHSTNEIRATTERCAEAIRERIAREEGKDFLLRADRKPEAVGTLLRPSAENADTPPEQLLRAATSDDKKTPA